MSAERENALFRALVEGEIEESSAEVREMFARDPRLEHEWRELKDVLSALDHSVRERREILDQASHLRDTPGEGPAERTLREAMMRPRTDASAPTEPVPAELLRERTRGPDGGRSHGIRVSVRPWAWIAAAAVVIACTVVGLRWTRSAHDGRDDTLLGNLELEPHSSIDPVSGEVRFEWQGMTMPGARYVITVQGRSTDSQPWSDVMKPLEITQTNWSAAKSVVDPWPRQLRWRVSTIEGEVHSPWTSLSLPR
jgi:hypothetical protein